jgi:hypothetical protein
MPQTGHHPGLALEAFQQVRIRFDVAVHDLDRYLVIQRQVPP